MTSLKTIAEQIMRLHYGGNVPDDAELNIREVYRLIGQVASKILKVEHISNISNFGEYFPPHAVIAEYRGITVTAEPISALEDKITCTEMKSGGFQVGTPSITATEAVNTAGTTYYQIVIETLDLIGVTAQEILDFINTGSDTCTLHFKGVNAPNYFLFVGIENLSVNSTTISFDYFPDALPQYWTDPTGTIWTTPDGYYWMAPNTANSFIPDIVNDLVQETHDLLAAISGSQTWSGYSFTNLEACCYDTNAVDLVSSFELPAMPIAAPRNMGVWRVWTDNYGTLNEFIPMQSQQYAMAYNISHTNMSSILGGMNTYEWNTHKKVVIYKPVTEIGTSINVQLLVVDPTNMKPTDLLPLHGDMEDTLIKEVLALLAARGEIDKVNDERDER